MTRITFNTMNQKQQKRSHSNAQDTSSDDMNQTNAGIHMEQDFAEFHAQSEMEYEQFITDTKNEIMKRAKRLSELKAIFYGKS